MRLDSPDVAVFDVHCPTTTVAGPEEVQGLDCFEVLVVRSGCFAFRDTRGEVLVDPSTCILGSPRHLGDVAHPAPGGDVYTHILLSPTVWHELTSDDQVPLAARVTGRMQVAARMTVAAGHETVDALAVEEQALNLVAAAVAQTHPVRMMSGRPGTSRRRRQLVEDARTILVHDPATARVRDVAVRLGCSPYHLSRVFHADTGMTIAGYRTRLRVNHAVQLLADEDLTIAETATQSGFADQAHLTRALRQHTGSTPHQLRTAFGHRPDDGWTRR